jgi:hypothetical protein
MTTLVEVLTSPEKKSSVVADCCELIDREVADKSGLSGLAIKAGYGAVKGIKPGFIKQVVDDLVPEFAKVLDPIYGEAKSKDEPLGAYFAKNGGRAADALLAITDGKAARSKHALVKGTYERLRGTAKKNVEQAIPRLGKLIEKHAG